MKKIVLVLIFGLFTIFNMSAFSLRAYGEIDWKEFEATSETVEITYDAASTIFNTVSDSSYYFLINEEGYFNVQLENGYQGIWMMIFADGQWFSVNYIFNPNKKYVGCYLTKYKYIGE